MIIATQSQTDEDPFFFYGLSLSDLNNMRYGRQPQVINYAAHGGKAGQYAIILYTEVSSEVIEETIKIHLPYAICPIVFGLNEQYWLSLYDFKMFRVGTEDRITHILCGGCTNKDLEAAIKVYFPNLDLISC
jgi:predicted Na+-dependent transporter